MEQYLYSVIASEMSSTSFLELLKAHAVISRSWVVSAINGLQNIPAPTSRIDDTNSDNHVGTNATLTACFTSVPTTIASVIRVYPM